MNGFADHGLNEGAFSEKAGGFRDGIRTFDAFRKKIDSTDIPQSKADPLCAS